MIDDVTGRDASPRSRVGRVGYAPGVYDLFHIGHLNVLRHASELCDHLVAGVVSDEMASRAKGRRPVVPLAERLELVRAVRYVDEVHAETVPEKLDTWRTVGFDVIFKGDDWKGTPKGDKLEADFAGVGVQVVYLPYTQHTSSTLLRGALDRLLAAPAPAAVSTALQPAHCGGHGPVATASPPAQRLPR